jgi:hypothetical protein
MKLAVVIDTNVPVVANGKHDKAGPKCEHACVEALRAARRQLILLDESYLILAEYRRNLAGSGQPGLGDAFFKWLWNNQANPDHCRLVAITPVGGSAFDYIEFPNDSDLVGFDQNDRKFAAVALASNMSPTILNASDRDWWNFRECLARNGVKVKFLCPELMVSSEE